MKQKIITSRYRPGKATISRELPERWAESDYRYGAITPTQGQWKGTPMMPRSKMAELLGWPGPCFCDINLCYQYPDGFHSVPIIKDGIIIGRKIRRQKFESDPPSVKAMSGWIDTGIIDLAWTDIDGNKVEVPCARKRKQPLKGNIDRRLNPVSSKRKIYSISSR